MTKYFSLLLLAASCSIIVWACQHKAENPVPAGGGSIGGGGNNGGGGTIDTGICFQRDILPIFISNCAKSGCHDANTQQDGYRFDSYQAIIAKKFYPGNANETELYEKITEDRPDKIMPPPPSAPLSAQQIALIRNWINQGASNTTNCGTVCDTTKFAYTADIKPMLDNNCKGCHNAVAASGGYSFENYPTTVSVINSGRFFGAIKHQSGFSAMPQGGTRLSDCQVRKIEKWVAAGLPNN